MSRSDSWPHVRLKWISRIDAGGTPDSTDASLWLNGDEPEGIPWIAIGDMSRRDLVASTKKSVTAAAIASKNLPIGSPGTVLLAMYASVGEVSTLGLRATWNQALVGFTPNPRTLLGRFLAYALRAVQSNLLSEVRSNTQDNLNASQVAATKIPLPPLDEQRAIADFLDEQTSRIDTLIDKQTQLIATLRERRAASIENLLSESEGQATRLKRHAYIQTGVTLSGDGAAGDPEWPYLRVANVQTGFVDTTVVKTVRVPHDVAHQSLLKTGDVLMTEGGDIDKLGRGSLWTGEIHPCLHQNHIFAVRPRSELDSAFLVYLLDSAASRLYFRLTARKTTNLASTNKWTLGNLPLTLPPIGAQRATVACIDEMVANIDTLITKTEQHIALAKERRAALITAAVTGQIDVRTAARAEKVSA